MHLKFYFPFSKLKEIKSVWDLCERKWNKETIIKTALM